MSRYYAPRPEDDDDEDWAEGVYESEDEPPDEEDQQMIHCPHCAKMIFDETEQCPHCGQYLSLEDAPPPKKSMFMIVMFAITLIMVLIMAIFN